MLKVMLALPLTLPVKGNANRLSKCRKSGSVERPNLIEWVLVPKSNQVVLSNSA